MRAGCTMSGYCMGANELWVSTLKPRCGLKRRSWISKVPELDTAYEELASLLRPLGCGSCDSCADSPSMREQYAVAAGRLAQISYTRYRIQHFGHTSYSRTRPVPRVLLAATFPIRHPPPFRHDPRYRLSRR